MTKTTPTPEQTKTNRLAKKQLKKIEHVLSLCEETLDDDILSMTPLERVAFWRSLQGYVRPKLSRTEYAGNRKGKNETGIPGQEIDKIIVTTFNASEEIEKLQKLKSAAGRLLVDLE